MKSAAACLALAFAPLAAPQPSTSSVNLYSAEREAELGREAAAALERALPIVHEPRLNAYVTRLGADLAAHANSPFVYRFVVYDDHLPASVEPPLLAMPESAFRGEAREPVAVAGGPVFVPLSLLATTAAEPSLALQLAHAMAHIALRHPSKRATREELAIVSHAPLRAEARPGSIEAVIVEASENPALQTGMIGLGRDYEHEADLAAARIVAGGGYDRPPVIAGRFEEIRAIARSLP